MSDKSATLIVIVPVTEQTYIRVIDTVAWRRYITAAAVLAPSAPSFIYFFIASAATRAHGTIYHY